MSTFTGQLDETGMLVCTVINWRNCTDLWMKGMMPKYKSIKGFSSVGNWGIPSMSQASRKKGGQHSKSFCSIIGKHLHFIFSQKHIDI